MERKKKEEEHPILPGRFCCFKVPFIPITHVIFDLDGTLLDTESSDYQVFKEVTESFGKSLPKEVYNKILGTNEFDACKTIVELLEIDGRPEEYQRKYQEKTYAVVPDAGFMKGAEKLVKHLYDQQIPIAIATSSTTLSVEKKRSKKTEFFDMFHHIVCGSGDPEVLRGKPYPNIYYVAARRFYERPRRHKCLVFEDSFNGVRAALGAGMQVVMTPNASTSYDKWRYATLRLDSLDQFIPELFGLPAFGSPIPPPKRQFDPKDINLECDCPENELFVINY